MEEVALEYEMPPGERCAKSIARSRTQARKALDDVRELLWMLRDTMAQLPPQLLQAAPRDGMASTAFGGPDAAVRFIESLPAATAVVDDDCPICLSELGADGEPVVALPCGGGAHRFHRRCVRDWAKLSSKCPLCRTPFGGVTDTICPAVSSVPPLSSPDATRRSGPDDSAATDWSADSTLLPGGAAAALPPDSTLLPRALAHAVPRAVVAPPPGPVPDAQRARGRPSARAPHLRVSPSSPESARALRSPPQAAPLMTPPCSSRPASRPKSEPGMRRLSAAGSLGVAGRQVAAVGRAQTPRAPSCAGRSAPVAAAKQAASGGGVSVPGRAACVAASAVKRPPLPARVSAGHC